MADPTPIIPAPLTLTSLDGISPDDQSSPLFYAVKAIQDQSNAIINYLKLSAKYPVQQDTLTLPSGANSDVAITLADSYLIKGPAAAFSVSGFTGGKAGRAITIENSTTQTMTLTNDAVSTSYNRIVTNTGADIVLGSKATVTLTYNGTTGRWVVSATHDALGSFTSRGLNTQLFTAGGTWTAPAGVTKAYITGVGGGGGGGGGNLAKQNAGGGGGAGDAIVRRDVVVVPGTGYTVTLGAGGTGGSGADGGNGTATSVGALISLAGGSGGLKGSTTTTNTPGNGGTPGGPGGSAGAGGIDGNPAGVGGGGGGGAPIIGTAANYCGTTYTVPYGAGGPGGGIEGGNGCTGGAGLCYVEW